jgi:hypothetical protein
MNVTIYVCDNVPEGLWERPSVREAGYTVGCSSAVLGEYPRVGVSSSADTFRDLIEQDLPTAATEYVFFLHAQHRLSGDEIAQCIDRHRDSGARVSVFPYHASVGAEWQHHLENIDQRVILSNTFPVTCRPHPKAVVPFIGSAVDAGLLKNFAHALRSHLIDRDEECCRTSESVSIMLAHYLRLQNEKMFCHANPVLSADFRGSDAKDVPNFFRRSFILGLHESLARQIGGDKAVTETLTTETPKTETLTTETSKTEVPDKDLRKLSCSDLLWRLIDVPVNAARQLYRVWKTPLSQLINKKNEQMKASLPEIVETSNVTVQQEWKRILDYGACVTPFNNREFGHWMDTAYLAGVETSEREAKEIFMLLSNSKITDISFQRFEVCL